jgi:hypothetical protein
MNSNNVVIFPKTYKGPRNEMADFSSIEKNIDMMRHFHIQETIANIAPMIFNQLIIAGFEFDYETPEGIKDGAMVLESLRALMCKHYEMYHPFQKIAEEIFVSEENEELEYSLKIVDSIEINLKN